MFVLFLEGKMKLEIPLVTRPQTRSLRFYYAFALALLGLSTVGALSARWPVPAGWSGDYHLPLIGMLVGGGLFIAYGYLHLAMLRTQYRISATAAEAQTGLLLRRETVVQLAAVRSIKVQQEPIQRLFQQGDVLLYTTSRDCLVLPGLFGVAGIVWC
jgi:membrane protein YdbS with pleckstrin-like domain